MKKLLFWLLIVPMSILTILISIIEFFIDNVTDAIDAWDTWCFKND